MSQNPDLDQLLGDWLADESPRDTSARLARAAISEARRTRRQRPLPSFLATLTGDPMLQTPSLRPGSVPGARVAFVSLALLALLAASVAVGIAGGWLRFDLRFSQAVTPIPSLPPTGPGLLAFDSAGDIWVATADGTGVSRVSDDPAAESAPAWSADGTRLAYWREAADGTSALVVTDLVLGTTATVATAQDPDINDPGHGPAWSADGTRLAFAAGPAAERAITVVAADGSGVLGTLAETVGDGSGAAYQPRFSPDGTLLAFAHAVGNAIELQVADVAADGSLGAPRTISHGSLEHPGPDAGIVWQGGASFAAIDWSSDGSQILTHAGTREIGGDLLIIAPDGSRQTDPLPGGDDTGNGAWSPDGTRFAYLVHVGDAPEADTLWIANADGSGAAQIEGIPQVNSQPAWSADGSLLAVRPATRGAIVVVPASPGAQSPVTIPTVDDVADPVFQPVAVELPALGG